MRPMNWFWCGLIAMLAATACAASPERQVVTVPSGNLKLGAYLWRPATSQPSPAVLFMHGSGDDATHTAGLAMDRAAALLGPVFAAHGYVFLYVCRRGQGLSADQAPYMMDALAREAAASGSAGRDQLLIKLLTVDHLDDLMAGLAFLRTVPGVDRQRIAIVGHSFGGQLALLAAARDPALRAVVTFGAAANSWARSQSMRDRLLASVRSATTPIMLLHAANDYSTVPGSTLADELAHRAVVHALKIYPPVGRTSDDGHNFIYTDVPLWERDVFQFLDAWR